MPIEQTPSAHIQGRVTQFQNLVWATYRKNTRIAMPWRETHTPYYVLLSELMLQQTQIARVASYFNKFTVQWPQLCDLAAAPLSDVLKAWMGLGYYRRAKYLHASAQVICADHGGVVPKDKQTLLTLPGIGDYTSAAILAFAYNIPTVLVETNVRRAIIHHFFANEPRVLEKDVREYVRLTVDEKKPRLWYWALMDYGASLAYKVQNPNRKSAVYTKQSGFEGSNRQVRAAILRAVVQKGGMRMNDIVSTVRETLASVAEQDERIYKNIEALTQEQFILCEKQRYYVK